jgi:hypothetical protein
MPHKFRPLLFLLSLFLFAKEMPFLYQWQNNTIYRIPWAEEGEKKTDQKEQEEKSSDDQKRQASIQNNLSICLTTVALHIIGENKYSAPSTEISSPPPEVFRTGKSRS